MPSVSVAICTHNPRQDYLARVLEALKAQTLSRSTWELLIIDNASNPPASPSIDLSWHPNARIIVEAELGIMLARLRAMREFSGELLVFLDDDNVLAEDYLERCLELFAERPDLGAVSGCLMPEYESPPPEWFAPYESWIAVRRITSSAWSNFVDERSEPVTAGMCLRRSVALAHVNAVRDNPTQRILGSRGSSLLRGEDVALAKNAMKAGYTVGQFSQLKLLHLIPKRRIAPEYLFALYRHLCASGHLISWVDEAGSKPIRVSWRMLARAAFRFVKGNQISRRLVIEELRGFQLARNTARTWSKAEQNNSANDNKR
ncbi:MAG: glycosyltransferase [Terracidiphilus sp.]|jgi:glycosyltransferase involved in cell wall biosynthesis